MNAGQAAQEWSEREAGAHSGGPDDAEALGPAGLRGTGISLLRYSPALVLVLIAIADAKRFADPDLWGHIRFGQAVLTLGHLARHDPYSYSAQGHLWRDHEWLSEVVMALVYNTTGVWGLKLWKFALSAVTVLFMVLAMGESGAPASVQLAVMTVAATALAPLMQFRPQLFTFAFLAALIAMLARDNYRQRAPIWPAIPMMAVWANFHGGFVVGVAVLAIYAVTGVVSDLVQRRGLQRSAHLAPVLVAAALATLATPYGIDSWFAVLHTLHNPMPRMSIAEWHPLIASMIETWHQVPGAVIYFVCVLGLLAALVISVARAPSVDDVQLLVIAAVMAVAAFISMRNMALFVITAVAPLAHHAAAALRARTASTAHENSEERSAIHPLVAILVALALSAYTGLFSRSLEGSIAFPNGAVAFMERNGLYGNILNDYDWGDYLIWRTAPRSKVFIDGRYETVYPVRVMRDYVRFGFGLRDAAKVLDGYPHDFVLVPPGSGGYRVASRSAVWKLIYEDPVAALFARADSSAARLPGVPIHGSAKPSLFP
jgi:hypothetical protein